MKRNVQTVIPKFQKRVERTKFDNYHWVDTSDGGLLVPEEIIHPVVSVSVLTWFIRYIYYWNLQFLNNVIILKKYGFLPQATLADIGLFRPLLKILTNTFKSFGFLLFVVECTW